MARTYEITLKVEVVATADPDAGHKLHAMRRAVGQALEETEHRIVATEISREDLAP